MQGYVRKQPRQGRISRQSLSQSCIDRMMEELQCILEIGEMLVTEVTFNEVNRDPTLSADGYGSGVRIDRLKHIGTSNPMPKHTRSTTTNAKTSERVRRRSRGKTWRGGGMVVNI